MPIDRGDEAIQKMRPKLAPPLHRKIGSAGMPSFLEQSELATWLPSHGFTRFGVAELKQPVSLALYDAWLAEGRNAGMSYLARQRGFKADPSTWYKGLRSALVFAIDYVEKTKSDYVTESLPLAHSSPMRTALYTRMRAAGEDYHDVLEAQLEPIVLELKRRFPNEEFRIAVDSSPIMERDLAVRAGLGWVGKNACVIDRSGGSLFFIAEILSSLPTNAAATEMLDHCGTCTRCLEACPTGALVEPRKLDARLCISYWTVEARDIAPASLREKFGGWFYGCDICQTVCPWNGKAFGRARMEVETNPAYDDKARTNLIKELGEILISSHTAIERKFAGTPMARSRGFGLKRNALIVAANLRLTELQPAIAALTENPRLSELATWSLAQLSLPAQEETFFD